MVAATARQLSLRIFRFGAGRRLGVSFRLVTSLVANLPHGFSFAVIGMLSLYFPNLMSRYLSGRVNVAAGGS
jgi:hypothetical protein